jgi:(p)ppGpp synthase/HD superfamily hydrolase
MLRLSSAEGRIAAVLHDVVDDSDITIDYLRQEGFSEQVLTAIEILTKRKGEYYAAFIERVAQDSIARQVKVEDLRDNMDLSRLGQKPLEKDFVRRPNMPRLFRD